ncbi:RNA polymerase sigma-70 factor (ECF subfamily) [Bogoriella caseilytica]|uniref:RNA polymerase sigma-70 factor (ECF subfamily) n=1 Tax=Bogoriella caseilytica TaxID=56055 RepID=A0A3N2BBK0_9MICO|nr:RNA polymerase sigma-70 factor (ECF subfamily) [Bogoriella caseilytica]
MRRYAPQGLAFIYDEDPLRDHRRRGVITLTGLRDGDAPRASAPSSGFDLADAYDQHGGEIFGFAINAVRDRGVAEECVQETFLRAWRARERFDPSRGALRTWLFTIARNVITDSYRRDARIPEPVEAGHMSQRSAPERDPADRLMAMEALASLSVEHRQVVVAVHLLGLGYAEVSDSTGVPVPTLRTRTFYALRALRRYLEGREGAS